MGWNKIRGHQSQIDHLRTALLRGRLAHAYLFVGPRGVGKQTFAMEFTKSLLCENHPDQLNACDVCAACAQVNAGTHPDFFQVQKPEDKHEFPIDLVRDFCNHLGLKSARGNRKVGLILDADDFNEESANCLLKTLEEPPPRSVLILLASTAEQQLPTIRSRCQIINFHPLNEKNLAEVLADHEVTEPEHVQRLVRLADGCPGRALALNDDTLWSFRTRLLNFITSPKPDVLSFTSEWAKYIEDAGKNTAAQRERVHAVLHLLLDLLKTAIRISVGADVHMDASELAKLKALADRVGTDELLSLVESCAEADYLIERRVQIVLVIDSLTGKFLRKPALA